MPWIHGNPQPCQRTRRIHARCAAQAQHERIATPERAPSEQLTIQLQRVHGTIVRLVGPLQVAHERIGPLKPDDVGVAGHTVQGEPDRAPLALDAIRGTCTHWHDQIHEPVTGHHAHVADDAPRRTRRRRKIGDGAGVDPDVESCVELHAHGIALPTGGAQHGAGNDEPLVGATRDRARDHDLIGIGRRDADTHKAERIAVGDGGNGAGHGDGVTNPEHGERCAAPHQSRRQLTRGNLASLGGLQRDRCRGLHGRWRGGGTGAGAQLGAGAGGQSHADTHRLVRAHGESRARLHTGRVEVRRARRIHRHSLGGQADRQRESTRLARGTSRQQLEHRTCARRHGDPRQECTIRMHHHGRAIDGQRRAAVVHGAEQKRGITRGDERAGRWVLDPDGQRTVSARNRRPDSSRRGIRPGPWRRGRTAGAGRGRQQKECDTQRVQRETGPKRGS